MKNIFALEARPYSKNPRYSRRDMILPAWAWPLHSGSVLMLMKASPSRLFLSLVPKRPDGTTTGREHYGTVMLSDGCYMERKGFSNALYKADAV